MAAAGLVKHDGNGWALTDRGYDVLRGAARHVSPGQALPGQDVLARIADGQSAAGTLSAAGFSADRYEWCDTIRA